jgi:hypothetical protein
MPEPQTSYTDGFFADKIAVASLQALAAALQQQRTANVEPRNAAAIGDTLQEVLSTFLPSTRRHVTNPYGRAARAITGGKGMAGLRADLRDGRITLREACMMGRGELRRRYRLKSGGSAYYMQRMLRLYAGGSALHDALGKPRKAPIEPA